jgi:hypothetical protein
MSVAAFDLMLSKGLLLLFKSQGIRECSAGYCRARLFAIINFKTLTTHFDKIASNGANKILRWWVMP